jgi:allantoinase
VGPGRHKISPYLGETLHGRVHTTVLRGEIVHDGGAFPSAPIGTALSGRGKAAA